MEQIPFSPTDLFRSYLQGTATEAEVRELLAWLKEHAPESITDIESIMEGVYLESFAEQPRLHADTSEKILNRLLAEIQEEADSAPIHRIGTGRRALYRWGWAAAVLIVVITGAYLWYVRGKTPEITAAQGQEQRFRNDVPAPSGAKTTLTLGNGTTIFLDSVQNGMLAHEGNIEVQKLGTGALSYRPAEGANPAATAPMINTLSTVRGGQTMITLSDGTKVWLNALSSLRYPTVFTGSERRVVLTGEAYFEVANNGKMPFRVSIASSGAAGNIPGGERAMLEVLGTHFNINAYGDEPAIKATLLEGRVKFSLPAMSAASPQEIVLQPGEQAVADMSDHGALPTIGLVQHADLEQTMAWKNGVFLFHSVDLASLLRQVSRWYDVDIEYKRPVAAKFNGEVPRNTSLSDMLKALEMSGEIKFGIEGKKIIVLK